jgi:hypothetical protein
VRPLEGDDVGDQAVGVVQALVHVRANDGVVVPAEGFEHFGHEAGGVGGIKATVTLGLLDQPDGFVGENLARGENRSGLFT